MTWKDLCDGWGIEPIAKELAKEVCCIICGQTKYLYTDQRQVVSTDWKTQQQYSKRRDEMLATIRPRCFCKNHAQWWFEE